VFAFDVAPDAEFGHWVVAKGYRSEAITEGPTHVQSSNPLAEQTQTDCFPI
jgi:hypothetical protein